MLSSCSSRAHQNTGDIRTNIPFKSFAGSLEYTPFAIVTTPHDGVLRNTSTAVRQPDQLT
jgi:hypothetical protein